MMAFDEKFHKNWKFGKLLLRFTLSQSLLIWHSRSGSISLAHIFYFLLGLQTGQTTLHDEFMAV